MEIVLPPRSYQRLKRLYHHCLQSLKRSQKKKKKVPRSHPLLEQDNCGLYAQAHLANTDQGQEGPGEGQILEKKGCRSGAMDGRNPLNNRLNSLELTGRKP
jgi:hypothetical protein